MNTDKNYFHFILKYFWFKLKKVYLCVTKGAMKHF